MAWRVPAHPRHEFALETVVSPDRFRQKSSRVRQAIYICCYAPITWQSVANMAGILATSSGFIRPDRVPCFHKPRRRSDAAASHSWPDVNPHAVVLACCVRPAAADFNFRACQLYPWCAQIPPSMQACRGTPRIPLNSQFNTIQPRKSAQIGAILLGHRVTFVTGCFRY